MLTEHYIELLRQSKFEMGEVARKIRKESKL